MNTPIPSATSNSASKMPAKGELQGWRPTLAQPNIPRPPEGIREDIAEHMRLMADILVVGLRPIPRASPR
jgi:hypothetical protein